MRFFLFNKITELFLKRLRDPSKNLVSFVVRETSPKWISPTLTFRINRKCLIETKIKSPQYANVLLNPCKVLIQQTKEAPELSAAFNHDCI